MCDKCYDLEKRIEALEGIEERLKTLEKSRTRHIQNFEAIAEYQVLINDKIKDIYSNHLKHLYITQAKINSVVRQDLNELLKLSITIMLKMNITTEEKAEELYSQIEKSSSEIQDINTDEKVKDLIRFSKYEDNNENNDD